MNYLLKCLSLYHRLPPSQQRNPEMGRWEVILEIFRDQHVCVCSVVSDSLQSDRL